jgi:hypothetical protein
MEQQQEMELIIRRFNNHAKIYGYPSKSFEIKVKKVLKNLKMTQRKNTRMTTEEINKRSSYIALMLGWYFEDHMWKVLESFNNGYIAKSKGSNLLFHSDWNWLLEAVEAIEKQKYVFNINTSPTISEKWICHRIIIKKHSQVFSNDSIVEYNSDYSNNESKKEAVVKAINQFLIYLEKNK